VIAKRCFALLAGVLLLSGSLEAAICGFSCMLSGLRAASPISAEASAGQDHCALVHHHLHHPLAAEMSDGSVKRAIASGSCELCRESAQKVFQVSPGSPTDALRSMAGSAHPNLASLPSHTPFGAFAYFVKAPPGDLDTLVVSPLNLRI
jgi:hypothetical protein